MVLDFWRVLEAHPPYVGVDERSQGLFGADCKFQELTLRHGDRANIDLLLPPRT